MSVDCRPSSDVCKPSSDVRRLSTVIRKPISVVRRPMSVRLYGETNKKPFKGKLLQVVMVFKINVAMNGKSYKFDLDGEQLVGHTIGEEVDGSLFSSELDGYK